jgi:hypothetical protein
MTTTIIIPEKIQATQPKPTKSQLLEALLERARVAHQEAEAEKQVQRERLEAEGIALVLQEFKKAKPTAEDVTFCQMWGDHDASIKLEFTSPKIKSLQNRIKKLNRTSFNEEDTKKLIREKLKAPNPLLGNPDTAKALDTLLATIVAPPSNALTVDV